MKRIIISVFLLAFTVILTFWSEKVTNRYCNSVKKELIEAVNQIEMREYKDAKEKVKNTKNDKSLVPYIYNLDFKKINKELADAENLLHLKEYDYAKICILRAISLTEDIREEYALLSR
ncbi:MAG TPA: hypothetical protein DEW35_00875 [Ruminococcaceae bacterium]|nr:hypothetical protein [Oscillospiraceae bacterium]